MRYLLFLMLILLSTNKALSQETAKGVEVLSLSKAQELALAPKPCSKAQKPP